MAEIRFKGADGSLVTVSAENPLPVSGAGGGGMEPADILAELPAEITDNGDGTVTVSVNVGTEAGTVAAGDHDHSGVYAPVSHTHTTSQVSGLDAALADLDRVAANVPNADGTDTTTLAASVDALRDALVAAGLMEPSA